MGTIGKIERIHLRDVWRHEAHGFTQWLVDHLDELSAVLDITLQNAERERAVGAFSADIVAEDENGDAVVIENQLEKSDHDHLGKLITYLSEMDAKAGVWIVADPRPEHAAAIKWLNESAGASFYMVKLEAIRIGDSPPAPLFTRIIGPSIESRATGLAKRELRDRDELRRRWWTQLIERSAAVSKLHAHVTPPSSSWISVAIGMRLDLNYVATQNECAAELYIDRGKDCEAENEVIFDQLLARKSPIEAAYGGALSWQRLEGKRACRIRGEMIPGGYCSPEAEWPALQDAVIGSMQRLHKALEPHLKNLSLRAAAVSGTAAG